MLRQFSPKFVAFQSARDILSKGEGSSLHTFTGTADSTPLRSAVSTPDTGSPTGSSASISLIGDLSGSAESRRPSPPVNRRAAPPQPKGPDGTAGFGEIHSVRRRALLEAGTTTATAPANLVAGTRPSPASTARPSKTPELHPCWEAATPAKWKCSCGWVNRPLNRKCGAGHPTFGCGLERPDSNVLSGKKTPGKGKKSIPEIVTS